MVCFFEIPTWAISANSWLMFRALLDHFFLSICFMYTIKGHQRSDNSGSLGLARCSEREYEYASVDLEYPLVSSCRFAIDVLGWKLYNMCAILFYDPTRDVHTRLKTNAVVDLPNRMVGPYEEWNACPLGDKSQRVFCNYALPTAWFVPRFQIRGHGHILLASRST
eukprot:scaffold360_cov374-Pavlova_lutheri.AAC.74